MAISRIIHLADLHIPKSVKRHTEYKLVFHNFYKKIDAVCNNDFNECLLVICGDILHNKDSISAEQIMLCRQFLEQCSNRMPVIVIPGNHDYNLNNNSKLDSLTPIVSGIKNVMYFSQSGVYDLDNIVFVVNSCTNNFYNHDDDSIVEQPKIPFICREQIVGSENKLVICLYHGIVNGSKNFSESAHTLDSDSNVSVRDLVDYDFVLLGDIHKHQYLKNHIAYSGSLIQQNYGESVDGHGFILWDLVTRSSSFYPVENIYCMYQWDFLKSNIENLKNIERQKHVHIKFVLKSGESSENSLEFYGRIEEVTSVIESRGQTIEGKAIVDSFDLNLLPRNGSFSAREATVDDINNLAFQNAMISKYCSEKGISDFELIELNKSIFDLCQKQNSEANYFRSLRLLRLSFKNVFSYHENKFDPNGFHTIHFEHFENSITGIIGMNHVGKSSILDIILFAFFDKSSRGKKQEILSRGKKNFEIRIEFSVCDRRYSVTKKGVLEKKKNVESVRITTDSREMLDGGDSLENNGNDRRETTSILKQILCEYDDLVFSSFLFQNDFEGFIELNQSDKVKFFHRMFKTDEYEKQSETVKSQIYENNKLFQNSLERCKKLERSISDINAEKETISSEQIHLMEAERSALNEQITICKLNMGNSSLPVHQLESELEFVSKQLCEITSEPTSEEELENSELVRIEKLELLMRENSAQISFCENKKKLLEASKKPAMQKFGKKVNKSEYSEAQERVKTLSASIEQMLVFAEEFQAQTTCYTALKKELVEIEKRLVTWEKLQDKYDPHCQYCRQNFHVDEKENVERELHAKKLCIQNFAFDLSEKEYEMFQEKIRENQEQIKIFQETIHIYENSGVEEWNNRINYIIEQVDNEILEIQQSLSKETALIKKKLHENKRVKTLREKKEQYSNRIKHIQLTEKLLLLNREIAVTTEKYRKNLSNKALLETYLHELEELKETVESCKKKQQTFELYIELFGKSGIPAMLFDRTIPSVEKVFNNLSQRLELNFVYHFKIDESKTSSVNYINIFLNGIQIEVCSGFEKLITSIFMRICIQKIHFFKSNFIFIDEGFSNLDVQNLQKVGRIFEILLENFENVFIVTHDGEISDHFKNVIIVTPNRLVIK